MPNKNQHIVKIEYGVATDHYGEPTEITVNTDVFFVVSDPDTIKETLALLKSRGVKSLGDFVDLVLRLAERSNFDEKTPIYSFPEVEAKRKPSHPRAKAMPPQLADALRGVVPQKREPLFLEGPRGGDKALSEDMARVFADKLGKAQAQVFGDQYLGPATLHVEGKSPCEGKLFYTPTGKRKV